MGRMAYTYTDDIYANVDVENNHTHQVGRSSIVSLVRTSLFLTPAEWAFHKSNRKIIKTTNRGRKEEKKEIQKQIQDSKT